MRNRICGLWKQDKPAPGSFHTNQLIGETVWTYDSSFIRKLIGKGRSPRILNSDSADTGILEKCVVPRDRLSRISVNGR